MLLQKQCVLQVRRCSLGGLLGQRKNPEATRKMALDFGANVGQLAGVTYLINPKNRQRKDVIAAGQAYREAGYKYSFQWGDTKGLRLVPCKALDSVRAETQLQTARLETAIDAYVQAYPELVREAEYRDTGLGLLFDASEYPSQRRIRKMFQYGTEYMPVPDAKHFIADMAEHMVNDAKAELTRNNAIRANEAVNDILGRVEAGVSEYLDKLSRYKITDDKVEATFRDSIVGNVTALADLVKKLNFSDDPGLNNLAEQINRLARFSAFRLRDDKSARDQMITEGKSLIARLDGMRKIDSEVDALIDSVADYM
jgi:hypothetical protein